MKVLSQPVTITNELGFHLRAAASFIKVASKFKADIEVERDGKRVSGKSIMGLMTLAAPRGATLTLLAHGRDARPALKALAALVNARFGEKA